MDALGRDVDDEGYLIKDGVRISRRPVKTINADPTRTKQNFKDELDVNNIIQRHTPNELLAQANAMELEYGQITSMDLREAIEKVNEANLLFEKVPSKIRAQFNNDPGLFIDYATNPENIDQMREWGLANPAPPEPSDYNKKTDTQGDPPDKE